MVQRWKEASSFLARTDATLLESGVLREHLTKIAENLKQLAAEVVFPRSDFPLARAGEEIVHELAQDLLSGIALYLVSDAPGARTPPHDHQTWAVIVGIEGIELNRLYKVTDS